MTEWIRYEDGAGWRILDDGRIVIEPGTSFGDLIPYVTTDDDGAIRTRGEPKTMRTLRSNHGLLIEDVANSFDLPASWVAAMISIEARRTGGRFDVVSLRHEPGYTSDLETPARVSAGLMQTLLSTACAMAQKYFDDLPGTGDGGVPRSSVLTVEDLFSAPISIALGTAYMREQADRYGEDPVLLVASYNAGGVYRTSKNPFLLRTYGYSRIPKFAAYHNDWLEVSSHG